eukprot:scaffold9718_cov33-Tisochrysis_lutea.AAC.1
MRTCGQEWLIYHRQVRTQHICQEKLMDLSQEVRTHTREPGPLGGCLQRATWGGLGGGALESQILCPDHSHCRRVSESQHA